MLYMCRFPNDVPMYNLPPSYRVSDYLDNRAASKCLPCTIKESIFSLNDDIMALGVRKGAMDGSLAVAHD
jgi:hypothetical protein